MSKYHWAQDAFFYHIYPLGMCAAPEKNDFNAPAVARLDQIYSWMDHLQMLGVNAVYLGPLFESESHGYDTADYYWVDRRLGTNDTLRNLVAEFHRRGMRVILDAVFNHVGRKFWAFRDVLEKGQGSPYCSWFKGLRFDERSPYQDPFTYETWSGYYSLVKLDLQNTDVRSHLFGAVEQWVHEYDIDGLRLDAADCLADDFLMALSSFSHSLKPDFWLMGEIVAGDYRHWVNDKMLDSVTNYECYKGLFSSHNDKNYFEISYSLNRQFGAQGIYQNMPLYNFADNHDVDRVASTLTNPAHIFPLYSLLFTMPGIPSIYYGSELGIKGKKVNGDDSPVRPALEYSQALVQNEFPDLTQSIAQLARVRSQSNALRCGSYRQIYVSHEQIVFMRETSEEVVLVAVNASQEPITVEFELPMPVYGEFIDLLNSGKSLSCTGKKLKLDLYPNWSRILKLAA